MKPRITVITLGVEDLEVSLRFYRDGLGFPTQGIIGQEFEHGAVVFIDMQPGLRLALWPRASIAQDTGISIGQFLPHRDDLGSQRILKSRSGRSHDSSCHGRGDYRQART